MPDSERFISTLRTFFTTTPRADPENVADAQPARIAERHVQGDVVAAIAAALGDPMSLPKDDRVEPGGSR